MFVPAAWPARLWGESRAVFSSDSPLPGMEVTLGHPSPSHLSAGSSSAAPSSSLASSKTLNPAVLPALPKSSPHQRISLHPLLAHLAAKPRFQSPVGDGRWMPKAGREHLGVGMGGCLRKRSLLSPAVSWNKASACAGLIGSSEV